jgi:hypothetical protein
VFSTYIEYKTRLSPTRLSMSYGCEFISMNVVVRCMKVAMLNIIYIIFYNDRTVAVIMTSLPWLSRWLKVGYIKHETYLSCTTIKNDLWIE